MREWRETSAGFRRVFYHSCPRVSLTTSDVFVMCDTTHRTGLRAKRKKRKAESLEKTVNAFFWITIQNRRANHFVSAVETEILNLSRTKPLAWNRFINDIFSLWITERKEIAEFITLPNRHHLTIKLTAEISEALRLLKTNSSAKSFYENIYNFTKRFRARGYPHEKYPLRLNLLNGIRLYKRTTKCERKFYLSLPRTTLLCQTIKTS